MFGGFFASLNGKIAIEAQKFGEMAIHSSRIRESDASVLDPKIVISFFASPGRGGFVFQARSFRIRTSLGATLAIFLHTHHQLSWQGSFANTISDLIEVLTFNF
jgi:hypothetical protein